MTIHLTEGARVDLAGIRGGMSCGDEGLPACDREALGACTRTLALVTCFACSGAAIDARISAAVAAEREECAKVCDENAASTREQRWWGTQESVALTFEAASEAIRARGAK